MQATCRCSGRPVLLEVIRHVLTSLQVDRRARRAKGAIERLYTAPPEGSVVVCLDEMGPQSAKSYPGRRRRSKPGRPPKARAGQAGGRLRPPRQGATSSAPSGRPPARRSPPPTRGRARRTGSTSSEQVEAWIPAEVERVYAIVDNLDSPPGDRRAAVPPGPPAVGVRLPAEVRGVPEPDRAVVEGAAVAGAEGAAVRDLGGDCQAVAEATAYWNKHRHPFVWGHGRRTAPCAAPGSSRCRMLQ